MKFLNHHNHGQVKTISCLIEKKITSAEIFLKAQP
jgi:hypothetical protein